MNWKQIAKKYPKAYRLLEKCALKNYGLPIGAGMSFLPDSMLYHFFDEHRLYIVLEMFDNADFTYHIYTNERYDDSEKSGTLLFGEKGNHTEELTDTLTIAFDKRSDAESAAFTEAFALMETHFQEMSEQVLKSNAETYPWPIADDADYTEKDIIEILSDYIFDQINVDEPQNVDTLMEEAKRKAEAFWSEWNNLEKYK